MLIKGMTVSRKTIIMIAAAGLVSFAGAFVFALVTKAAPQSRGHEEPELNQLSSARQGAELKLPQPAATAREAAAGGDKRMKRAMTEEQLKGLVYEVREKMREYNDKLQGLEAHEQRLQIVQNMIKEDVEELNKLRVELASTVAGLKSERDKLLKSRVEIAGAEKNNLVKIAATYDKMDAASAGKILTNISDSADETGSKEGNLNDAVKILYYMSERARAKLLAELAGSDPKFAWLLCQRLKQVVEK